MDEKDTYKYHLKIRHKVVHRNITRDPVRREAEHQREFPGSQLVLIGRRTTWGAALKWARKGGQRAYKRHLKIKEVEKNEEENGSSESTF